MKYNNVFETTADYQSALPNLSKPQLAHTLDNSSVYVLSEDKPVQPSDEIWYTTIDRQIFDVSTALTNLQNFITTQGMVGTVTNPIKSNTYDEKGIIKYANNVTTVGLEIAEEGRYNIHPFLACEMEGTTILTADNIETITLPNGVTTIHYSAFEACKHLLTANLPATITSIGQYAFNNCTSLIDIKYEGTIAQWNAITKASTWKLNCPTINVRCSDGNVKI